MYGDESWDDLITANSKYEQRRILNHQHQPVPQPDSEILQTGFTLFGKPTLNYNSKINTFKYHVFAPMGRFQLELIYLYFPPSFHQTVVVSGQKEQLFDGNTVENKGKLILTIIPSFLKCPRNISILALVIPHSHFFKLILHNFIGV